MRFVVAPDKGCRARRKKSHAYARAKAEWGARPARPSRVAHAPCRTHARRPTRHRSDALGRHPPPPDTRGRCAPRSYNSSSRARLSDCGGGGRKPVSRRPCRVATARSTYHTAAVPAILVDEGGARIAGPATPERSWPARARTRSPRAAYAYWRTHAQAQTTLPALVASAQNEFWSRPGPSQSLHNRLTVRSGARAGFYNFSLVSASKPSLLLFSPIGSRCESKINYISMSLFVWLWDRILLNHNNSVSTHRVFVFRCVRARCVLCLFFLFNIFIKVLIFFILPRWFAFFRAKCVYAVLVSLQPFFCIDFCEFLRWYYIYIVIFSVRWKFNLIACCCYFSKIVVQSQHTVHCWIRTRLFLD